MKGVEFRDIVKDYNAFATKVGALWSEGKKRYKNKEFDIDM
jgi:hypothetical protein